MKIKLSTHKPNRSLWLVALVLFVYGLTGLPYGGIALIVSAALLLLGTTVL
jgi:hypothetical protein